MTAHPSPRVALVVGLATLWLPGQDLRVVDRSQPLAGAFDPARGRFVTVGWRGETTEFDGSRWLSRPIDPLPVLQTEQRMVHDDARARMILVGGDLATPLLTTRAFDGASWSTLTQNGPPGRQAFALVSDAARSVVVLFGGISFTGPLLDETWIFDGQVWSQAAPTSSPSPRHSAATCYDRARSRVVLFGGRTDAVTVVDDTWEWDGTTWAPVPVAVSPAARYAAVMSYDATRSRAVLFGGFDSAYRNDVWEFDGNAWQSATPSVAGPDACVGGFMAFDPNRGECVFTGGYHDGIVLFDTWSWDGTRWQQLSGTQPARNLLANDVAFGSPNGDGMLVFRPVLGETWTWTRAAGWAERQVAPPSPARFFTVGCSTAATAFVYGGLGIAAPNPDLTDLWQWNGQAWTQLASQGPLIADGASMAFDIARGEIVLFGVPSQTNLANETWVWSNSAWQQRALNSTLSTRYGAGLVCDPLRGTVVLHGGYTPWTSTWINDTWEWNGTDWLPITTPNVPTPSGATVAYDITRGAVVRVGYDATGAVELWSYDGLDWTPVPVGSSGQRLLTFTAIGWPDSSGLLLYGASANFDLSADQATVSRYGSACTAQAPVLTANERPRIGTPGFALELAGAPASSFAALLAATGAASIPLANCTQLVQAGQATLLLPTSATGFVTAALPVPPGPTFFGLDLYFQAAVLDPSAPSGFTTTRGLRCTIGR